MADRTFSASRYRWPEAYRFRHVLPGSAFTVKPATATPAVPAGDYVRVSARKAIRCRVAFSGKPEPVANGSPVYVPAALPVAHAFWRGGDCDG